MSPASAPFLDPSSIRGLYDDGFRLAGRTAALLRAKTVGEHPADVIIAQAARRMGRATPGPVLDIGCGNGTSTLRLKAAFASRDVAAVDLSPAVLRTATTRAGNIGIPITAVCADFRALPFPDGAAALAVAAFCLYHCPDPGRVLAEIARCLHPDGLLVAATKSADSYAGIDDAVQAAGLDDDACDQPSLYQTFHSGNIADATPPTLLVLDVIHHRHEFTFTDTRDLATYIASTPKYSIPEPLHRDVDAIAKQLRAVCGLMPVRTTSTVSYLVAGRAVPGDA